MGWSRRSLFKGKEIFLLLCLPLFIQHLQNMPCKVFIYFAVPWNRLTVSGLGVLIPVMPGSISHQ